MAEALNAIFKFVGAPVEIDAIVAILANAWSVKNRPAEAEHDSLDDDESFSFDDALTDERQISIADEVGQRFYLEKLWERNHAIAVAPAICTAIEPSRYARCERARVALHYRHRIS